MNLRDLLAKAGTTVADSTDYASKLMSLRQMSGDTRALSLSELEDRILLSASPVAAAVGPVVEQSAGMLVENTTELTEVAAPAENTTTHREEGVTHELVFVDASAEDYRQLLDDLWSNKDPQRHLDVVLLSSNRDGIEQITETLAQYTDDKLDAVHFVSHGNDGGVQLGNTWFNSSSLQANQSLVSSWSHALHADADLLFYGCDLASGEDGLQFLSDIAETTGADIAASTNETGAVTLGGDWVLEHKTGEVETETPFSFELQTSWQHTLDYETGLLSHYTFDEGGEDSVGNRDATLIGTGLSAGQVGQNALNVTGDFDYAMVSDAQAPNFGTGDFSVSFWFNSNQLPSGVERILGDSDGSTGYVFYTDSFGDLNFSIYGTTGNLWVSESGLLDGNWHHVVGVRNGNDFQLHVDGTLRDSATLDVGNINSPESLYMGVSTPSTNEFDGLIDDVRLYNTALDATAITELQTLVTTVTVDTTADYASGHLDYGDTSSIAALIADKGDDNLISLREAIDAANNQFGKDRIEFNIAGLGIHTISLSSALPTITESVQIDGWSETDFSGTPLIAIDAAGAGSVDALQLATGSDGSLIRGVQIWNARDDGIQIDSDNNIIVGNYIGTDGTNDFGSSFDGLRISGNNNQIGGTGANERNLISGNNDDGIQLQGTASGNILAGNIIGLAADGVSLIGNSSNGIELSSTTFGNTIGGSTFADRNVISGNQNGIILSGSDNNTISANFIGTDITGNIGVGQTSDGIRLESDATGNTIGGATTAHGNVISGNSGDGIQIDGEASDGNSIRNNKIGVTYDGSNIPGNGQDGIFISAGADNTSIADNHIAGNSLAGINLDGNSADTVIQGNIIGTDSTGLFNWGNGQSGILIENGASTTIGGSSAGLGNVIAFSGQSSSFDAGIWIQGSGTGQVIRGNSIYANEGLGINIASGNEDINGVSLNTADTSIASGTSNPQNYPVLTTADFSGGTVTIAGSLTSAANTSYRIDYFASDAADPSGFGEGQTYLGSRDVTTNGSGIANVDVVLSTSLQAGSVISATATLLDIGDADVETSEFSQSVAVTFQHSVEGYIYEDVDGDGDILDDGATVAGATVYIYLDGGDGIADGVDDTYVTSEGTDAGGQFLTSVSDGTYWFVVDSKTITPGVSVAGGDVDDIWAEQTYAGVGGVTYDGATYSYSGSAGALYGGVEADVSDKIVDATNALTLSMAEHINRVVVAGSDVTGVDFGFSYSAITNTSDGGDDDGTNDRTIQGSLRQFMQNAEAMAGVQSSYFAISNDDANYDAPTNSYRIQLSGSALPFLNDGNIVLDATMQNGYDGTPSVILDGSLLLAADQHGIQSDQQGVTVRGFVIQNFTGTAIHLDDGSNHVIQGNYIGTDVAGTGLAGNKTGIHLGGGADTALIGGTGAGQGNVISGNSEYGIDLNGVMSSTVAGNFIGTDYTGTQDLGNLIDGIRIGSGAALNLIGGTTASARNIISGNDNDGIWINGASNNTVQGNWIGVGSDGSDLGNLYHGIGIDTGSTNNLIGGTVAGAGNRIAFNVWDGISISDTSSFNSLLGNIITDNDDLAIDLSDDGVTLNDESLTPPSPQHDADTGPNHLQNFPVLWVADITGTDLHLVGNVESAPSTQYRIEFYNNPVGTEDGTGYGEARVFLGAVSVTTDAFGEASIDTVLSGVSVAVGDRISATATEILNPAQIGIDDAAAYGSTSEMSQNLPAAAAPTDLSTGVAINTNGGTDTYLHATDGGSVMNNLTAITFETTFQIEEPNTGSNTLISYRTGLQHNEFYVTIYPDGRLWLGIDSIGLGELQSLNTYPELLDGNLHHLAVSWDSSTGEVIFYIDGAQAEPPLNYQQGRTISSGGNLVFGQDQDATADVYEADEAFRGTFHDIRIWNGIRSAAEIALNYEHKFDSSNIPTGLLANWQMKSLAGGTTVEDLVNPGTRDLTVQHVGAVGAFTPGNATTVIEIAENSPNGTHVTYVRPTDPEVVADGTYTYAFDVLGDAGGRFAIHATTGEITVANGLSIDYEADTFHDLNLVVTDAEGGEHRETVRVNVTNINDSGPQQSLPTPQTTNEDTTLTFSIANGNAITVDDGTPATDTRLQVWLGVQGFNGTITLSQTNGLSFPGGSNGSGSMVIWGTEADINAALEGAVFTPNPSYTGPANITVETKLAADLQGLYEFENSGNVGQDTSVGLLQSGTPFGPPSIEIDGQRGSVLRLDNIGEYIRIDELFNEPVDVTLSAWINADSVDTLGASVISLGTSPALYLHTDGTLIGYYESGGTNNIVQSTESLVGTGWRHVAVSIDAANSMTIYIDGAPVQTITPIGAIEYDNSPDTYIGRAGDGGPGFDFDGKIDEARIYTRALSAEEIAAVAAESHTALGTISLTVTPVNGAPTFNVNGTTSFTSHDITTTAADARNVETADLDGDGDLDVLSASAQDNSIVWYENDGNENFTTHVITSTALGAKNVFTSDIDGDGDLDVLSASSNDDTIAWYENDGTQNFTQHVITSTANGAYDVAAADFDGDGDIDIVAASSVANTVTWYENDGAENFTEHTIVTGATFANTVELGDLDGDGDIDILSTWVNANTLAWHENDGTGNFTTNIISNTLDGVNDVAVADVDGDGNLDLLTAANVAQRIVWHENDGSQNFTSHDIGILTSPESVDAADIDGDGDIDVVASGLNSDNVVWYENDGSENFTSQNIATGVNGPRDTAIADVDGDGDLDVLSASSSDDTIAWYENATITSSLNGNPPYTEGGVGVVLDTDVNVSDAELDALNGGAGNYSGSSLTIVRNGGVNAEDVLSFNDGNDITLVGDNLIKNSHVIAMFDTSIDGQLVITFTDANGEIPTSSDVDNILRQITYANSSDAPPASVQIEWTFDDGGDSVATQGSPGALQAVGFTTVNITSVNDAPTLTSTSLTAINEDNTDPPGETIANLFAGNFTDPDAGSSFTGVAIVTSPAPLDTGYWQYSTDAGTTWHDVGSVSSTTALMVDTDTMVRFVPVANFNGGVPQLNVHAIDNTYLGSFTSGASRVIANVQTNGGSTPYSGSTASIGHTVNSNADAPIASDNTVILANSGVTGTTVNEFDFVGSNVSGNLSGPRSVASGDIDGDGDIDLVAGDYRTLDWYQNNGTGNYTAIALAGFNGQAEFVTVADLNQDGHQDILITTWINNEVIWYENDGAQNFTQQSLATLDHVSHFEVADLDGDGDLDIVAAELGGQNVTWLENDGSENFAVNVVEATAGNIRSVVVRDLDADGDLDIVYNTSSQVRWLENDGAESFSSNLVGTHSSVLGLGVEDFNGDGDLDVVAVTNSGSGGLLRWYENDGSESFTAQNITTLYAARNLITGDFDADGDFDFVVPEFTTSQVKAYYNDGAGNFSELVVGDNQGSLNWVAAGDFNGDGLHDFASNAGASGPVILEQRNNNVLIGDVDNDGDTLQNVQLITGPSFASSFTLNTDGTFSYTHDGSGNLSDSFTYTVDDGTGQTSNIATVTVSVLNANPVVATNGGLTLPEGGTATITQADLEVTDVDNTADQIIYTMTQDAVHGTIRNNGIALGVGGTFTQKDINDGLVTYQDTDVETTSDSFNFTISDGVGGTVSETTFNITVTPVNDAPVLSLGPGGGTYYENATGVYIDSIASITDVDSLNFSGGQLNVSVTGAGTLNDRLVIRDGLSNDGLNVQVIGNSVEVDGVSVGTVSGGTRFDSGNEDPLIIAFNGNATVARVQAVAQRISFHNVSDDPSGLQRTISMFVTDGDGGTSNIDTRVENVIPVNDAPQRIAGSVDPLTVDEDAGLTSLGLSLVDYTAVEAGQSLTFNVTTIPDSSFGTVYLDDGTTAVAVGSYSLGDIRGMQFRPTANANGVSFFEYQVIDDGGTANLGNDTLGQSIMLTVNSVNDSPTSTDATASGDEDSVIAITLSGSDVDGTVDSFEISSLPANGTLYLDAALTDEAVQFNTYAATSELLTVYFDPNPNWNGSTTFTFAATDNQGRWDATPATATITVNAVNDAPVVDLDIDNSTATGNNYTAAWTDAGPVNIADTDFSINDADNANLSIVTVTITNLLDGAAETLSADVSGTSLTENYNSGTGVLELSGSDTVANYQQVLGTVTYNNSALTPDATARVIEVVANDGTDDSVLATSTLSISDETVPGITVTAGTTTADFQQTTVWDSDVASDGSYHGGSVAMNDSGRTVVTWHTTGDGSIDGDRSAVMARIYDELGNPVGNAFQVNTSTISWQDNPSIAMDDTGNFVIVWMSSDADATGIYGQRFDAVGNTLGGEFRVNTTETGGQYWAHVDMNAAGEFVVVWESSDASGSGVFVQKFAADGTATGGEVQVNQFTTNNQQDVDVAIDDSGRFTVVWASSGQDGSGRGVYMRQFDTNSVALGNEALVNTTTSSDQWITAVDMNGSGETAIAWRDDSNDHLYFQLYGKDGSVKGGPTQITTTSVAENYPAIALDDAGNVTVAWQNQSDGDDYTIVAREFDSNGTPTSGEFIVNTKTEWYQEYPSIAMTGDGQFTIVWTEPDSAGDSSWNPSIEMRRYSATTTEGGGAVTFSISLDTPPAFDVTIPLTLSDGTEGLLSTNSITFTPDNWNIAQTIMVTGLDDAVADGDITHYLEIGAASSADPEYNGLDVVDRRIINLDNEPHLDLDEDDSSGSVNADYVASWTEDSGPVLISDTDATLHDNDSSNLASLTVTITNLLDGASELLSADATGTSILTSYDSGTGTLTLSGSDTVARYQQVLRTVTYNNSSDTPTTTTRVITFVANDGTNDSNTATTNVSIAAVNDPPVIGTNSLSITEGATLVLSNTDISTTDPDSTASQLIYTATNISAGQFELVSDPGNAITTFSQDDINTGKVQFVHNGGENPPAYDVSVSDGQYTDGPHAATIVFSGTNDAPTISAISNQTANEDTVLGPLNFTVGDAETAAGTLTVTATSSDQSIFADANLVMGGSGANRTITLTPETNMNGGPVTITVSVFDGTTTSMETFAVTVDPVNDAPITNGNTYNIVTDENTPSTPVLVDDLLTNVGWSDADASPLKGIAITGDSAVHGDWEYSTNGTDWTNIGAPTVPNALLLDSNSYIRFLPDGTQGTTATFGFIAWDQSDGLTPSANGAASYGDASNRGGEEAYSNSFRSVAVTVSEVADAPTISAIANQTISEDASTGTINFTVGDIDTAVGSLVVTATSSNQSLIPDGNITLGGSAANRTISLTPLADQFGTATITVSVFDGSLTTQTTFTVDVTAVNDDPVLANNSLTISEGGIVTLLASDLNASDIDNVDSGLIFNVSSITAGHFELVSAPQTAITSFTQAQLTANQVRFIHDGSETAPTYDVSVSDGTVNTVPASATITFTNVNDAPLITGLGGDAITIFNDGTPTIIDVNAPAGLLDSDLPANYDGATLTLSGNGFDILDQLGLDTSGVLGLSTDFANGSVLSVSGLNVGTLSSVSSSGATITFNANATLTHVNQILHSVTFDTTSSTLGKRTVEFVFNDGDGTANGGAEVSSIETVAILVAQQGDGLVSTDEDVTYTFTASDFDFTGITGNNLQSIEILSLPIQGTLQVNGSAASVGQVITKAEIDSGLLTFVPDANENGATYGSFDFQINQGKLSVSVLAGEANSFTLNGGSLLPTDLILANPDNFGPSGTYSSSLSVVNSTTTIDASYLAQGQVLFDGYVPDGNWQPAELAALDTWVLGGGILISTSDSTAYDAVSDYYGLTVTSTSNTQWYVADDTSRIMNGPFGSVGPNGSTFFATGAIGAFDTASLAVGDQILAVDSISGEPTIILRQHGSGWILFTADEGIFRANMSNDGTVSLPNDILSANVFAWAADLAPVTTAHTMNIDVEAVNDDPQNTGTLPSSITVDEDTTTAVDLSGMNLSDIDVSTGNLTLTLNALNGGTLNAVGVGGVSVTGGGSSNLELMGTQSDLNTFLDNPTSVTFTGVLNSNGINADTIQLSVTDNGNLGKNGGGQISLGDISVNINAVNDIPTISAIPNQTVLEEAPTGPISFTIDDVETAAGALILSATSDNQTIVPDGNITFGGSGANRTINIQPALNQNGGPVTITVNVSDGTVTTTRTFTVTVNPVNDAPTISAISDQTVDEDNVLGPLNFTVGDVETTSSSLTVLATSNDQSIFADANLVIGGTGANRTITLTPEWNANGGPVTITLSVFDGSATTQTVFDVTVNAVNDAPFQDGIVATTIAEGDSVTLDAGAWGDYDGGPLTYEWDLDGDGNFAEVGEPTTPTALINWTTLQSFGINDDGTYTLAVRANDGNGGVGTGTMLLTVSNTAPMTNPDGGLNFTTDENSTLITGNVLLNDADPAEGDTLSVQSIDTTGMLGNLINNGDGTFTYDPNGQFESLQVGQSATDTFQYTVTDGDGGVSTTTVTITIDGVNDLPVADDGGPYVIAEGDDLLLDATGSTDAENDVLSYFWDIDNDGAYDDATGVSPTVTWAQLQALGINDNGVYTIGLRVIDAQSGASTTSTTLTVTNTPPTANPDSGVSFTTDENSSFMTGNVLTNDTDPSGDTLSVFSFNTTGTLGTVIDNGDGTFTYNPNGQFEGLDDGETATDTFTYTVTDSSDTATTTVTVTINGVNDAPTISPITNQVVTEDNTLGPINVNIGDVDVETLTLTATSDSQTIIPDGNISLGGTGSNRTLTLTPAANENGGPVTITLTVHDGTVSTQTTFTVTVIADNDPPTQDAVAVESINEGDSVTLNAGAWLDLDGGALSYTWDLNGDGTFGDALGATPTVTWATLETFGINDNGTFTPVVRANDGNGGITDGSMLLIVSNTNPTANSDGGVNFTTNENTSFVTIDVRSNDTDPSSADTLSVTSIDTTGTLGTVINNGNGTFSYDPNGLFESLNAGQSATDTFTYILSDDDGGTSTSTVTITITGVDDTPTITQNSLTISEGETVVLATSDLSAGDIDTLEDTLTFTVESVTNGQFEQVGNPGTSITSFTLLDVRNGNIQFVHNGEEIAPNYTLSVSDITSTSGSSAATIVFTNVNDAPVISAGDFSVNEHTSVGTLVSAVSASDPDAGTTLTFRIAAGNSGGIFTIDPSTGDISILDRAALVYETNAMVSMRLEVADEAGLIDSQDIIVTVVNINDAPTPGATPTLSVASTDILTLTSPGLALGAQDIDGNNITPVLISGPANGVLTMNPDGSVDYDPNDSFFGTETISFVLTDGLEESSLVTWSIEVTPMGPPIDVVDPDVDPNDEDNTEEEDQDDTESEETLTPLQTPTQTVGGGQPIQVATPQTNPAGSSNSDELPATFAASSDVRDTTEVSRVFARLLPPEVAAFTTDWAYEPQSELEEQATAALSFIVQSSFWNQLDNLQNDLQQSSGQQQFFETVVVGTTAAMTGGFTVGYVLWLIRGGSLVATMMSVMPTWSTFDPLPVLDRFQTVADDEDQEDLASLVIGNHH